MPRQSLRIPSVCALAGVLLLIPAFGVAALTTTGSLGEVAYAVYAPDWTWQKRDINVLVVLDNHGPRTADVYVGLVFPSRKADHFVYSGDTETVIQALPGESTRYAFTNIQARDGVPRQIYDFALTFSCGGVTTRVPYAVRTIRGAAVNSGQWALYVPLAIALVWSLVFACVLPRLAGRGAWRRPGEAVKSAEDREAWIDQTPA
ncbi:MAG TPA: hypothetical protein PLO37_19630 [Candidatus Hydrogenedentes bacterium]|nr:hypothetical protein [Candidatus Hydrogenedentota bacterium]HPG69065.1 hypothetical protein [Candidatus Hydrogenedentota bacterium]